MVAAAAAKSLQSCPTLCDPIDSSTPGSSLFMRFSRQEYWSGLPFLPPGDLPHPGIEPASPVSPALQVDSLPSEPMGKPLHNLLNHFLVLLLNSFLISIINFGFQKCLMDRENDCHCFPNRGKGVILVYPKQI